MPSLIPLYALAFTRMGVGIGLLAAPVASSAAFMIPTAPAAVLGARLAGGRDLAVGGLLLHSIRQQRRRSHEETKLLSSTGSQPEHTIPPVEAGMKNANAQQNLMMKSALGTGIVIDALDVLSCAACYFEGFLPADAALLVGGFAAGAVGLGWYNYMVRTSASA